MLTVQGLCFNSLDDPHLPVSIYLNKPLQKTNEKQTDVDSLPMGMDKRIKGATLVDFPCDYAYRVFHLSSIFIIEELF